MTNRRYYWDFFGPRALGTAQHFQRHLEEFLLKQALESCTTGVLEPGAGHAAAFCDAPLAAQSTIESLLRPRRIESQ